MKVLLKYENGNLYQDDGAMITCWAGLESHEYKESESMPSSAKVAELVSLGMAADDIIKLKISGVI